MTNETERRKAVDDQGKSINQSIGCVTIGQNLTVKRGPTARPIPPSAKATASKWNFFSSFLDGFFDPEDTRRDWSPSWSNEAPRWRRPSGRTSSNLYHDKIPPPRPSPSHSRKCKCRWPKQSAAYHACDRDVGEESRPLERRPRRECRRISDQSASARISACLMGRDPSLYLPSVVNYCEKFMKIREFSIFGWWNQSIDQSIDQSTMTRKQETLFFTSGVEHGIRNPIWG